MVVLAHTKVVVPRQNVLQGAEPRWVQKVKKSIKEKTHSGIHRRKLNTPALNNSFARASLDGGARLAARLGSLSALHRTFIWFKSLCCHCALRSCMCAFTPVFFFFLPKPAAGANRHAVRQVAELQVLPFREAPRTVSIEKRTQHVRRLKGGVRP